jgi:hypothetical protein
MDDSTVSYWDSKAHEAARKHPLLMAGWFAAEYVGSLAIAAQDAIETKMRTAVDA